VGGKRGGGGMGEEMTQALYAHMNNKTIKKFLKKIYCKLICKCHGISFLYNYYMLINKKFLNEIEIFL
jgi:hypothetical protein